VFESRRAVVVVYGQFLRSYTKKGDNYRQLHPDAVFKLVAIMELHAV
jgi:hypothetical protein